MGLNRGAWHYTLGMAVPLALWLFGPELLLAAAVGTTLMLWRLDRP
ncbi:MAG: DUF599 family protein [Thiohalorhabdaceae bacterium]